LRQTNFPGQADCWLVQPAVQADNQAGVRLAKWAQLFERGLYIPQVVDQIGEQDDVKGFVDGQAVRFRQKKI